METKLNHISKELLEDIKAAKKVMADKGCKGPYMAHIPLYCGLHNKECVFVYRDGKELEHE